MKRNTIGLVTAISNGMQLGSGIRNFNAFEAEELLVSLEDEGWAEQYDDLRFREALPVFNGNNMATSGYKWNTSQVTGEAKIIGGYSDDLPSASFTESGKQTSVRTLGVSYHYNVIELAQAQATGDPLEDNRAGAARYGMEKKLNDIAWNGETSAGLFGVFNHPDIAPNAIAANAGGTSTRFSDKSALEIVADFNYMISVMVGADDNGKYKPTRIYLPLQQYLDVTLTVVPDTNGKTIIKWLIENNPYITEGMIQPLQDCNGAGAGGVDVAVVLQKEKRHFEFKIPYAPQFMPSQIDGLAFKRPMIATVGGLVVRHPEAIAIFEGI